jgi:hypothetical protein
LEISPYATNVDNVWRRIVLHLFAGREGVFAGSLLWTFPNPMPPAKGSQRRISDALVLEFFDDYFVNTNEVTFALDIEFS